MDTLAEHNRLGLLPGVAEKFDTLMGAHRGEVELVVTSASVRPSDFTILGLYLADDGL
jgi:F-type H+-transporting ATPase subunit O